MFHESHARHHSTPRLSFSLILVGSTCFRSICSLRAHLILCCSRSTFELATIFLVLYGYDLNNPQKIKGGATGYASRYRDAHNKRDSKSGKNPLEQKTRAFAPNETGNNPPERTHRPLRTSRRGCFGRGSARSRCR